MHQAAALFLTQRKLTHALCKLNCCTARVFHHLVLQHSARCAHLTAAGTTACATTTTRSIASWPAGFARLDQKSTPAQAMDSMCACRAQQQPVKDSTRHRWRRPPQHGACLDHAYAVYNTSTGQHVHRRTSDTLRKLKSYTRASLSVHTLRGNKQATALLPLCHQYICV
jgi:hypothetical protein